MKLLVCYLSSTYLELFGASNNQRLTFPQEVVQYGEILEENKFKEVLLGFVGKLKLKKNKGVILLSPELVFSSELDISSKNKKEILDQFLATVPVGKNNVATVLLEKNNKLKVCAVNKKFYEIICQVFKQKSIEIYSVAPVNVFPLKLKNITLQQINQILNEKKLLETYNFLQSKQPENNQDIEQNDLPVQNVTKQSMQKQYVMFGISLLLFVGAIIYYLLWSETIINPWFKKSVSLPVKTRLIPTSTIITQPSPIAKPIEKPAATIQILNGSGIEGKAGILSNLLSGVGYKNITVGNADNLEQKTSIIYNKQLSKDAVDGVLTVVKKDFSNVLSQEATASGKFDIIIILGKD